MRAIRRRILRIFGAFVAAIVLLIAAMWISEDVRYAIVYAVMERFDLNSPVSPAMLARQTTALRQVEHRDPFIRNDPPVL
jgi:hypothetical protein